LRRRQLFILALLVAAAASLVHARILAYPFIQDDWIRLDEARTTDPLTLFLRELSPFDKGEYRPLGTLYFILIARVIGLHPFVTHLIALLIHIGTSILVGLVVSRMTRDRVVGWSTAILYASASGVHMDPLMWASGIVDVAGTFLVLLSLWQVYRGRTSVALAAFTAALFFKESTIFVPFLLAAIAWSEQRRHQSSRVAAARWLAPFAVVFAGYLALKLNGISPLTLGDNDPYVVRFTGPHVLRNVLTYARWGVGALFPWRPLSEVASASVLGAVALLLGIGAILGRRGKDVGALDGVVPLMVWLFGALGLVLFMPNHVYRYYWTAALPALLALIVLSLTVTLRTASVPRAAGAIVVCLFTLSSVVSSFKYFQEIDRLGLNQPYVEGTNDLVRRGKTVTAVKDGLRAMHPTFPPGAVLLFKSIEIWALGKDAAPRVWYELPSLRVYDAADLQSGEGRWYLRNPAESQVERYTGATSGQLSLAGLPVFLFELTDGRLTEQPLPAPSQ
jgi:hypothetical protein